MSVKPFYPEKVPAISETVGIVLSNHVGSSVAEDTGRDAQHLADTTGFIVIAADRPGSGWAAPNSARARLLADDYVEASVGTARKIEKELTANGISRAVAAGRSAGGTFSLSLARTEIAPVTHIYAAEAAGWYEQSVSEGKHAYRQYGKMQKELLDGPVDLVRPEPSDVTGFGKISRALAIGANFFSDQYHNKHVWSQATSLRSAAYIARSMPDVFMQLDFAEHSMMAPQHQIENLQMSLPEMRLDGRDSPRVQMVRVEQLPRTVHASFDNRGFFAERLLPIAMEAIQEDTPRS
jgi:pimeloyl-ACP methyl ester carboxylesterase